MAAIFQDGLGRETELVMRSLATAESDGAVATCSVLPAEPGNVAVRSAGTATGGTGTADAADTGKGAAGALSTAGSARARASISMASPAEEKRRLGSRSM